MDLQKEEIERRSHAAIPMLLKIKEASSTPGISFGVSMNGKPIYAGGFGYRNARDKSPMDEHTLVNIASVTKSFTVAAIGILVDEEILSWHEPVCKYLPEFRTVQDPTMGSRITLMDLFSHRTGLARNDMLWYGLENTQVLEKNDLLNLVNNLPYRDSLRARWTYNNFGVALAGLVLENVTKMPLEDFIRTRLLEPLDLRRTTMSPDWIADENYSTPHVILDDGSAKCISQPTVVGGTAMAPTGAIRTSICELLQWGDAWMEALASEKHQYEAGTAISNLWASREEKQSATSTSGRPIANPLRQTHIIATGRMPLDDSGSCYEGAYCLGLARYMLPSNNLGMIASNGRQPTHLLGRDSPPLLTLQHSGMYTGFNTAFYMFPAFRICIAVMSNAYGRGDTAEWIAWHLIQEVFDLKPKLNMLQIAQDRAKVVLDVLPKQKAEYDARRIHGSPRSPNSNFVGTYYNRGYRMSLAIDAENCEEGTIFMTINGMVNQRRRYKHYHYDVYGVLEDLSSEEYLTRTMIDYAYWEMCLLAFQRGLDGNVSGINWTMNTKCPPVYFAKTS